MIAALAAGPVAPEQWGQAARAVDFYDLQADLEALFAPRTLSFEPVSHPALHPGRAASVRLDGRAIGMLGELHPVWVQRHELGSAPVLFEVELEAALDSALPACADISRMPAVHRDLALVVNADLRADKVLASLWAAAPATVRAIELFDVYQGKGIEPDRKSLAFRVLMQDTQRTLEDAEVDAAVSNLVQHAASVLGARLRGAGD